MDITIEEAKLEKRRLEQKIEHELRQFPLFTGLIIEEVIMTKISLNGIAPYFRVEIKVAL